jgi:hypothetical protein
MQGLTAAMLVRKPVKSVMLEIERSESDPQEGLCSNSLFKMRGDSRNKKPPRSSCLSHDEMASNSGYLLVYGVSLTLIAASSAKR